MTAEGNTGSPLRIILSGGIGSGKSTVLRIVRESGAAVIEADSIGHQVLRPGGAAYPAVAARWPSVVSKGRIDRARLAAIVFTDKDQLRVLESLTHPHIRDEIGRQVAAAADRDIVVELPLTAGPVDPGWIRIVVDAPDDVRLERTVARGMPMDDAVNRIAIQPDRAGWIEGADIVIENTGTIADLESEVRRVWRRLHEGFAR